MLSRLPLPESPNSVPLPGETSYIFNGHTSRVTSECCSNSNMDTWTSKDPVLSKVQTMVLQGWTHTTLDELKPYQQRKDQLSVHDGCVLLGSRVIIPVAGQAT